MKEAIGKLHRISELSQFCFKIVAAACMVVIIIATTWGVFTRYFLNDPQGWTEEISLLMLVWFALFAATASTFGKKHIYADFLFNQFPEKMKIIVRAASAVMAIVFLVVFLFSAHEVIPSVREFTSVLNISRKMYYYPIYLCVPFMIYSYVVELIEFATTGRIDVSDDMART